MIDYTKLLDKLSPQPGGEDTIRLRSGVVDTVNADGTADVALSGVVVPDIPVWGSVEVAAGVVVSVISYLGQLIVAGVVATSSLDHRSARGVMAAPRRITSDGTATAANTTEIRDAVFGNYVFTAQAGRQYRVVYTGNGNAGAAGRFTHRIRDGGASTPTTASTMIAENTMRMATLGTTGRQTMTLAEAFTATAGTRTLSLFTISPESVVMTPVTAGVGRTMYVEDIGPV